MLFEMYKNFWGGRQRRFVALARCTHGLLHLRCGDLAVLLGDSMKTSWQGTVALLQSEFFSQFQDGHILVLINKAIGGLVEEGK